MQQLDLLIVVPAYNEEYFIKGCLSSISNALKDSGLMYEIVIVDNGSNDRTGDIAKALGAMVMRIARASVSAARNVGASAVDSKYIAFIDADVVITPEWAVALVRLVRGQPPALVLTGCQYSIRDEAGWIEKYWFKNLRDKYLNGGNIIISRAAFERLAGFDESLKTGEDYDLCIRALLGGIQCVVDDGFHAVHLGYPRTLAGFIRREMWHGEGDFRSWAAFGGSPVAIIGVGYLVVIIAIVLLMAQQPLLASVLLVGLLVSNLVLTAMRFSGCGGNTILINSIFNLVYFLARAMSFFSAMKSIRKKY